MLALRYHNTHKRPGAAEPPSLTLALKQQPCSLSPFIGADLPLGWSSETASCRLTLHVCLEICTYLVRCGVCQVISQPSLCYGSRFASFKLRFELSPWCGCCRNTPLTKQHLYTLHHMLWRRAHLMNFLLQNEVIQDR